MRHNALAIGAFSAILALAGAGTVQAEVIHEDQGLYKKETWGIAKRYDDLGTRADRPGVVTSGQDPRKPSGPAVDFKNRPGSTPQAPGSGG